MSQNVDTNQKQKTTKPERERSEFAKFVRRFAQHHMAVVGLVIVLFFIFLGTIGNVLTGDPTAQDFSAVLQRPFGEYWLGTDELGRDLLARVSYGAGISLLAGLFSTVLAMVIGVPLGLIAGYYRGKLDSVISKITDVLLAFPFLILAVGLTAILGPSIQNVIIALAIGQVPSVIRIVRGEALGLREQEFVTGAVADGAGDITIMGRYILPNMVNVLIVKATVTIPAGIIGEATLSFLGLGVQPPNASWGVLLTSSQQYLSQAPYLAIIPGIAIALATLGFNLLGDGLRDVLDPRGRR